MRQRYLITKEGIANDLVIQEYAVLGQDPRQKQGVVAFEDNYTFLYQENYKGKIVEGSISKGINDLIATLRTDHLFPIGIFAEAIAASVIELYRSSEDGSAELLFDDNDQFKQN
jgi:hypothetical protein